MAVSRLRNEPTIRPTTPKCALEETALLVPLSGPNMAIGPSTSAPTATPKAFAAMACQNDRPNMMGNAPSTAVAREFAPPQHTRMKSRIEELRSASGIDSTPCRSNPGGRFASAASEYVGAVRLGRATGWLDVTDACITYGESMTSA